MWQPQVAALSHVVPVVAPDFPGFGLGGGDPVEVLSMDLAADAAARALSEAGIDQALVCGLSMGGYAALAFLGLGRGWSRLRRGGRSYPPSTDLFVPNWEVFLRAEGRLVPPRPDLYEGMCM